MLKAILARVASAGTLANPFAAIPGGKTALPARSRPRNTSVSVALGNRHKAVQPSMTWRRTGRPRPRSRSTLRSPPLASHEPLKVAA
jgi:hypothetical protein